MCAAQELRKLKEMEKMAADDLKMRPQVLSVLRKTTIPINTIGEQSQKIQRADILRRVMWSLLKDWHKRNMLKRCFRLSERK